MQKMHRAANEGKGRILTYVTEAEFFKQHNSLCVMTYRRFLIPRGLYMGAQINIYNFVNSGGEECPYNNERSVRRSAVSFHSTMVGK